LQNIFAARGGDILGSARASRARFGALAETHLAGQLNRFISLKVRDGEGAIAGTRGRVHSPEPESLLLASPTRHILFRTEDVDENNQRDQLR
jgi:hypothetical protein